MYDYACYCDSRTVQLRNGVYYTITYHDYILLYYPISEYILSFYVANTVIWGFRLYYV